MQDWFNLLKTKKLRLVTAESCTGGLIATTITDQPGASNIFERGFVTYSNEAKQDLLGVPATTLKSKGAVSAEVAEAMASGALSRSDADIAISCTGIAGPDGGTEAKPVGLVYIGIACRGKPPKSYEHRFEGDRNAIRRHTVEAAFSHILEECL